jgi:uncharacterized protein YciI
MKFINFAKYKDLETIASVRPAHFAYADRLRARGELAIGGPLLDDHGRRIGLLFVYEAVSRNAALALAQQDPFTLANALSDYQITEWRLRGVKLDLLVKANRSADQSAGKDTQIRLFANYAKYGGNKSRLAAVRPLHWQYDQTLESAGKLALAGPFANDEGGLFVYNAVDREQAMSYLKQDPFAIEEEFADYELLEWLIEGVNPDLLASDFSSEKASEPSLTGTAEEVLVEIGRIQAFNGEAILSCAAIFTSAGRESAFIFCMTFPRCALTVISLMPISQPTCLFNSPEITNAMTSRSRLVSDA